MRHEGRPYKRQISRFTKAYLTCFTAIACAAAAACGGKAAEAPPPAQPLSEERATHLIAGILEESGSKPARGMTVPLEGGTLLDVDIGEVGGGFGIAYITANDRG